MIELFKKNGYVVVKGLFPKELVREIKAESLAVFKNILLNKEYLKKVPRYSEEEIFEGMKKLFREDLLTFQNTGKQLQHLIALHRLALDNRILEILQLLELRHPIICTRPVLYFNHKDLARDRIYHTVGPHQDWRSMQGSLNSIVVWLPLMNITEEQGALRILPGSQKEGLLSNEMVKGFGMVEVDEQENLSMESIELKEGDALFFSSFLVHASGNNRSNLPRWSCHFRYNDLSEKTFIERGYPHPYIYKPKPELLFPNFPGSTNIIKEN